MCALFNEVLILTFFYLLFEFCIVLFIFLFFLSFIHYVFLRTLRSDLCGLGRSKGGSRHVRKASGAAAGAKFPARGRNFPARGARARIFRAGPFEKCIFRCSFDHPETLRALTQVVHFPQNLERNLGPGGPPPDPGGNFFSRGIFPGFSRIFGGFPGFP